MKLEGIGKIVSYVIIALAVILYVVGLSKGDDAIAADPGAQAISTDPSLYLAYISIILTAIAAVGFAIWQLIQFPKRAKSVLYGVVGVVVAGVLAYLVSSDAPVVTASGVEVDGDTARRVGAGLIVFYIAGGIAIVSVIASSVSSALKR